MDFADELTGFGGRIDGEGNGVLQSLSLRGWLEVPELRYNRVTVLRSVTWATAGAAVLAEVVPTDEVSGRAWLKLEEGEPGSLCVDDICMGIWHDLGQTEASHDDGSGNFVFKGFRTCYFQVTGVAADGSWVDYVLRPVSDRFPVATHPVEGMNVAAYGNASKPDRQKSRYETTSYVRYLAGVDEYEFGPQNVMAQFGDLSNLEVDNRKMSGYSAYLNNIYMDGTIKQFEQWRMEMQLDFEGADGSAIAAPVELRPGEAVSVRASVVKAFEEQRVSRWAIVRSSTDADADAAWNALHSDLPCAEPTHLTLGLTYADLGTFHRPTFRLGATLEAGGEVSKSFVMVRLTPVVTDRGLWRIGEGYHAGETVSGEGILEISDVWHLGNRWRCLQPHVADATNAPCNGSPWWEWVGGDDEFYVTFAEPEMLASLSDFRYPLTVRATLHGEDVTGRTTVAWSRRSEMADGTEREDLDALWTARNRSRGHAITLTGEDLDLGSYPLGRVQFTATVTLSLPEAEARVAEVGAEFGAG